MLSGFAALLYQTAWLRLFSTIFGTSEYAVTIVLAAYMGGLALGAWVAGRYLDRIHSPIFAYGILELMIAVSALCVPLLMTFSGFALTAIVGGQAELPNAGGFLQLGFYIIASFIVLGIPTTCMGATLPILLRQVIHSDRQIGSRTGMLYAINTIGAVFGTVIAAFVFLPALGMRGTVWFGVVVNILIYLIAVIIALAQGIDSEDRMLRPRTSELGMAQIVPKKMHWMLCVMLGSGIISFVYEVLWTRMLGHIVGGSVVAFATMLAAFLSGIALGGFIGGILATSKKRASWLFIAAQILIAIFSAYIYYNLEKNVPGIRSVKTHAITAFSVMLPATIFIGMTFPLAVRILSDTAEQSSLQAARIYMWNTCGAVIGALAAGFVIIPNLGFEGTIVLCVIANLALGLIVFFYQLPRSQIWFSTLLGIALCISAVLWRPSRPDAIIKHAFFGHSQAATNEEFFAVGRSSTVLSLSSFHEIFYRSNGLPEANVMRKGAGPTILSQQWLGAIPPLFRPDAKSMLVVGYGGGAVLEAIPQHIESVDVVELEPEVIEANRVTAHLRMQDPLKDPRINIVFNDARNALKLSNKKFDIIVSQPSHPWTAGASHLFTKEYMKLVRRHLNREGVFLQWINAEFVTETLLRDLTATLLSEFRYVRMVQAQRNALHFYASNSPLDIESDLPTVGKIISKEQQLFASIGVNSFNDILAAIVLDENGTTSFARTGKIIRDNQNQLAVLSRQYGDGLKFYALMNILKPFDPLIHNNTLKVRDMPKERALYILGSLVRLGMPNRALDVMNTLDTEEYRRLAQAIIYKASGDKFAAQQAVNLAFQNIVDNPDAVFIANYEILDNPDLNTDDIIGNVQNRDLATVFILSEAAKKGDWQTIFDQDEALTQVPVTRSYAGQALYLRARSRFELLKDQEGLEKAIALIERSHLVEPTAEKLILRAKLADRLQDSDRVLNSIWQIVFSRNNLNVTGGGGDTKKQSYLPEFAQLLSRVTDPTLEERVNVLKSRLEHVSSTQVGSKTSDGTTQP
ncbi:MAG: fused MFS/spermidine synthase [Hyphomonadaceae bacterium]|nr:fused MFS/spermidine synthase [Hyphomonadaceae bacterium]